MPPCASANTKQCRTALVYVSGPLPTRSLHHSLPSSPRFRCRCRPGWQLEPHPARDKKGGAWSRIVPETEIRPIEPERPQLSRRLVGNRGSAAKRVLRPCSEQHGSGRAGGRGGASPRRGPSPPACGGPAKSRRAARPTPQRSARPRGSPPATHTSTVNEAIHKSDAASL